VPDTRNYISRGNVVEVWEEQRYLEELEVLGAATSLGHIFDVEAKGEEIERDDVHIELWLAYDSTFRASVLPALVCDRDSSLTQVQTEVADYVDNHPGADECDIAQALRLPLLQVYHITRELENRAVLRRGHNG